uniref:Aspartyl protease n=1 Tax=Candidatus Kentrum sp. LFY TaxID=2126342 RepID=A0A450UGQ0_9GAMM|nr:MAG: Aspartyl protease [Candidatus Kentron sp. LFY]
MGRIVTTVDIENLTAAGKSKKIDVLVDTGASYLTLPLAWKEQFGFFNTEEPVDLQTATQAVVKGTVCGPVRIRVEGFRAVYNEVLFLDMEPNGDEYEPLLGYIVLEQCGAAVDMIGHRLVPVKYMDLKAAPTEHFSGGPRQRRGSIQPPHGTAAPEQEAQK